MSFEWQFIVIVLLVILFGCVLVVKPVYPSPIDNLINYVELAESSGDPRAISPDGKSIGLHQISQPVLDEWNAAHPDKQYSLGDMYQPEISYSVAHWYLSRLNKWLTRHGYPYDIPRLVFAYNAGMGRLRSRGFVIPSWAYEHDNLIYRWLINGGLSAKY